jgi:hypothetical protein
MQRRETKTRNPIAGNMHRYNKAAVIPNKTGKKGPYNRQEFKSFDLV